MRFANLSYLYSPFSDFSDLSGDISQLRLTSSHWSYLCLVKGWQLWWFWWDL